MSMFGGLSTEGHEETQDRVGGFQAFDSNAYDGEITMAYGLKSSGGALGVYLAVKFDDGREYRETIYTTDKKGQTFYLNKNDPTKKIPLPGFTVMNDICLVTTEKPLSQQEDEEKIVNVYDPDQKKELPKAVPVLVGLLGKRITLGILKATENKSVKDSGGNYVPVADTREANNIDKVFEFNTKGTTVEARNNQPLGEFYKVWVERNQGKTRDNRKIKDGQGGTAGKPGQNAGPPASGTAQAPKKSLFGGNS